MSQTKRRTLKWGRYDIIRHNIIYYVLWSISHFITAIIRVALVSVARFSLAIARYAGSRLAVG